MEEDPGFDSSGGYSSDAWEKEAADSDSYGSESFEDSFGVPARSTASSTRGAACLQDDDCHGADEERRNIAGGQESIMSICEAAAALGEYATATEERRDNDNNTRQHAMISIIPVSRGAVAVGDSTSAARRGQESFGLAAPTCPGGIKNEGKEGATSQEIFSPPRPARTDDEILPPALLAANVLADDDAISSTSSPRLESAPFPVGSAAPQILSPESCALLVEAPEESEDDPQFALLESCLEAWGVPPAFPAYPLTRRVGGLRRRCLPQVDQQPAAVTVSPGGFDEDVGVGCRQGVARGDFPTANPRYGSPLLVVAAAATALSSKPGVFDRGCFDRIIKQNGENQGRGRRRRRETLSETEVHIATKNPPLSDQSRRDQTAPIVRRSPPVESRNIGLFCYPRWVEMREHTPWGRVKRAADGVRRRTSGKPLRAWAEVKRPWPRNRAQWAKFQPTGKPQVHTDRSKIRVSRSLIGRIGALAAMEKMRHPPSCLAHDKPGVAGAAESRSRKAGRYSKTAGVPMQSRGKLSTFASIKAEKVRTRRDHDAWLARVASGLDKVVQDPLSLLGECLEQGRLTRGLTPRETAKPLACYPERSVWRNDSTEVNPGSDQQAAARRRFLLTTTHLEDLVASSRGLLLDEEKRAAAESPDNRERRARIRGYIFGDDRQKKCNAASKGEEIGGDGSGGGRDYRVSSRQTALPPDSEEQDESPAAGKYWVVAEDTGEDEADAGLTTVGRTGCCSSDGRDVASGRRTALGVAENNDGVTVEEFARRCLAESRVLMS